MQLQCGGLLRRGYIQRNTDPQARVPARQHVRPHARQEGNLGVHVALYRT